MMLSVIPALLMGAAGGVHCIAMCGGVASAACGARPKRFVPALAFNFGRILTYGAFGALAGAVGAVPLSFLPLDVVRVALRGVAALLLFGVGLHLAGFAGVLARIETLGLPLWSRLRPIARRYVPAQTGPQAAVLGAIWAFVPCGLVYGALSLALGAGSLEGGLLTMLAFGVGTLPVMTAVTLVLGTTLRRLASGGARRLAGALVAALAVQQVVLVAEQTAFARSVGLPVHACCYGGK